MSSEDVAPAYDSSGHRLATGDIVTRDGTDEQRVISADDLMIHVICIKAPASGWCKVGDEEHNLSRRYELVRASDHSAPRNDDAKGGT